MMKIAVDLDGVIWDIMKVFLELYNEKYGTDIKYEDVTSWYHFPQERFEAIYPPTLERIKEYPFLDENINHYLFLLMGKHDVKILTHEANTKRNLMMKLDEAGIRKGLEYLELIKQDRFDGDKLSIEFDVYIDDCPLLVEKMKEYPNRVLLLFDQPWNRHCNEEQNVFRVKGWKDVMLKIEELEQNV